jgi:hypothetical protein
MSPLHADWLLTLRLGSTKTVPEPAVENGPGIEIPKPAKPNMDTIERSAIANEKSHRTTEPQDVEAGRRENFEAEVASKCFFLYLSGQHCRPKTVTNFKHKESAMRKTIYHL